MLARRASVRELRVPIYIVPIYVIRNARPTDRHFSFHMIVVNPANYPFSEHADSAQPRIINGSRYTAEKPVGGPGGRGRPGVGCTSRERRRASGAYASRVSSDS